MKRLVLVVLLASWFACEPGYESGKTKCSTAGKCPSGFVCTAGNVCVSGGTSGPSGGDDLCAVGASDNACTVCDKQQCCQQIAACANSTACVNLLSCLRDCTTDSCDASCTSTYAAGVAPVNAWANCLNASCSVACSSSGGAGGSGGTKVVASGGSTGRGGSGGAAGAAGTGGTTSGTGICAIASDDNACIVCDKQRCCQEMNVCLTNSACPALATCLNNCTTDSCESDCFTTYAAGVAPMSVWGVCLTNACGEVCSASGGSGVGGTSGSGGASGASGGTGGAPTTCTGTMCPGGCVDTSTDASNCGGCGKTCVSGQRCLRGACVCDATSCPQSCCTGNACAVTQSDTACGISGEACGACGPSGDTVTFVEGRAKGAMTGYGWVAMGSLDSVTDPTCQGQPMTADTSFCLGGIKWSSSTALCLSGSIPALNATNPDYDNNWGLKLGVDATLNKSGTLGKVSRTLGRSFTSMTIAVTGSPLTGLRATVHRNGDPDTVEYCAALNSGVAIPLTAFNTKCYAVPVDGVFLKPEDVPNIDSIGVNVPSGNRELKVTNLCINSITFSSAALSNCSPTVVGGGCADSGKLFCGTKCCSPTYPYHCSATSTCYATEADALAACGSTACTACVPATASSG